MVTKIAIAVLLTLLTNIGLTQNASEDERVQAALTELLNTLEDIIPEKHNIKEWEHIRTVMRSQRAYLEETGNVDKVLGEVLSTLGQIAPEKHNKKEWKEIRGVCGRLRSSNESTCGKLHDLLLQLSKTIPEKHNKREWATIRTMATSQLRQLKSCSERDED